MSVFASIKATLSREKPLEKTLVDSQAFSPAFPKSNFVQSNHSFEALTQNHLRSQTIVYLSIHLHVIRPGKASVLGDRQATFIFLPQGSQSYIQLSAEAASPSPSTSNCRKEVRPLGCSPHCRMACCTSLSPHSLPLSHAFAQRRRAFGMSGGLLQEVVVEP